MQDENTKSGVSTLTTDEGSLQALCESGLGQLCPNINELTLEINKAVNLNTVFEAAKVYPNLTKLRFVRSSDFWISLDQSAAFCKSLISSYHLLTSLSFVYVGLGNKTTIEIIGYLRHHQNLDSIE